MQSTEAFFRQTLLAVLGDMLSAAGYTLNQQPIQWNAGLFRFRRGLRPGIDLLAEYQLLVHPQAAPRFQVNLARALTRQAEATAALPAVRLTLPVLLWDVFEVQVLPGPKHWWAFSDIPELGDGLLESGKLLAGYGLPWLDGSLVPGQEDTG